MEGWSEFAVAAAGASAALAGLVIVAISVNVKEILRSRHLVANAGVTIASLIVALLAALALLVPQTPLALGIEILVLVAVASVLESRAIADEVRVGGQLSARQLVGNIALDVVWILAFLIAGILLCVSSPAGPYALAIGIALAVCSSIASTWVLLIEILR